MELYKESRIRGEFTGWDGDAVFALDNGSIWQQVNYKYRYRYKYRPHAKILRDGGTYYLEVEGMDETIRVRRIQ